MADDLKPCPAIAVAQRRFTDCGPGAWWFVHHPGGFLIEIGDDQGTAELIANEINAGRAALTPTPQEDKAAGWIGTHCVGECSDPGAQECRCWMVEGRKPAPQEDK